MEKTPRYTQRERNMVLGFAAQYKDVIENKRTDAESNRKKDEVWRQIAKEFNARVYHQRSSKQLRQLYKNMKLLLKKDLCGDGRNNRTFMDLLEKLSQQDSVAQYIKEQMSPSGFSLTDSNGLGGLGNNGAGNGDGRHAKYDDFDDSKLPSVSYDGMDTDVIVIKSEDISDNDQSQGCDMDDMDDDDCLSTKDIPEVCLEEEDEELFANDLRPQLQYLAAHQQRQHLQQQTQSLGPEVTIQNVGGIRVGSIGSMANMKALQNGDNNSITSSPLSIMHPLHNNNNNNNNNNNTNSNNVNNNTDNNNVNNNNNNNSNNRQLTPEQAQQQQLLLSGLGLSAVHHSTTEANALSNLTALQRLNNNNNNNMNNNNNNNTNTTTNNNNNNNNNINNNNRNNNNAVQTSSLLHINGGISHSNFSSKTNSLLSSLGLAGLNLVAGFTNQQQNHSQHNSNNNNINNHNNHNNQNQHMHNNNNNNNNNNNGNHSTSNSRQHNEYMMSLAIEERKRKIDLINVQIEYWKALTKQLDTNGVHNPTCLCHFPGKVNGIQTPTSSGS